MGFLAMGLSTVAGWLGFTQLRVILGLVAIIGAGIVVTGAYVKGRMDQASNCKEAALEQKIAGLERDLQAQKDADAIEDATMDVLKTRAAIQETMIDDYERQIAEQKDAGAPPADCTVDQSLRDRIKRLRGE